MMSDQPGWAGMSTREPLLPRPSGGILCKTDGGGDGLGRLQVHAGAAERTCSRRQGGQQPRCSQTVKEGGRQALGAHRRRRGS